MEDTEGQSLPFLDKVVDFPNGTSYELINPITNFKSCHDGTPSEARILFLCRRTPKDSEPRSAEEFIMKIKVQILSPSHPDNTSPEAGPSDTTAAELKALEIFRDADTPYAPHLVAWKRDVQLETGMLPGGYLTFTVMTRLPGNTAYNLRYWDLNAEEREEIKEGFLPALRAIYALGIEPVDRGLRNILWERETKTCTIIDFELWNKTKEIISDEKKELQRWGLERRPPPRDWWHEWSLHMR